MRAEVRRAADRAAATLYEQQRDRIFNLCLAMLHDRGDAEDAVQETFARVTQRIGALDGDPAGYLVVVARNVCRDELRRRSRQRTERADAGGGLAGRGAEEAAVDRSTLRDIWRRLGAGERTLFAYAFSGLSLAEIAQRTGTSVDAAAQRMSRARQQARRLVGVPAALLLPLVNGQAMGRLVQRLHSLGGQIPAVILRSDPAQQLLVPLVLGIVAGSLSVPGSGGRMAPARPDLALAGPAPVLATATSPDASGLHVAPAVPVLPQRTPAAPSRAVAAAPKGVPPPPGATFTSFTPSPDYSNDRTVFAASSTTCVPACGTLWRSQDAGHTWQLLSTASLGSSTVLLPPAYPTDPTLFVYSQSYGLMRSDDGGRTFRVVTPGQGGTAVVDPTSSPGDARVVIANQAGNTGPPLLVYSENNDSTVTLSTLPPGVLMVYRLFTAPRASAVYVVTEMTDGLTTSPALFACTGAQPCRRLTTNASVLSSAVAVSNTFSADRTYFTSGNSGGGYQVQIATLDGALQTVDLGDRQAVAILPAADYAVSHRLDIVAQTTDAAGHTHPAALRSVFGGAPVTAAMALDPLMSLASMTRLPDGRLLVGVMSGYAAPTSLLCSADDGMSWTPTC